MQIIPVWGLGVYRFLENPKSIRDFVAKLVKASDCYLDLRVIWVRDLDREIESSNLSEVDLFVLGTHACVLFIMGVDVVYLSCWMSIKCC